MSRKYEESEQEHTGQPQEGKASQEIRFFADSAEDIEKSMEGLPDGMRDRLHDAFKKRIELIKRGKEAAHNSGREKPSQRPSNR